MPKLVFLGTSNAIPDENHENTHMAILGDKHRLLIDCVGNPIVRLPKAGIDVLSITDLILTHFHPDHVSGVPLFLMDSWLMKRKDKLNIYGLKYTLDQIQMNMDGYEWDTWPKFFPVDFHETSAVEMTPLFDYEDMRVFASPVHHLLPTIGLRVEFPDRGKVLAYSCDTEPSQQTIQLAKHADLLIHEASGKTQGHTSAAQAGEIAEQANVKKLLLIHYSFRQMDAVTLVSEAKSTFGGEVALAEDLLEIVLSK